MKLLNKEILDLFVKKHADAVKPIDRWIEVLENAKWQNHNELKELFPNADYAGNSRYVFNIKGNSSSCYFCSQFGNGLFCRYARRI